MNAIVQGAQTPRKIGILGYLISLVLSVLVVLLYMSSSFKSMGPNAGLAGLAVYVTAIFVFFGCAGIINIMIFSAWMLNLKLKNQSSHTNFWNFYIFLLCTIVFLITVYLNQRVILTTLPILFSVVLYSVPLLSISTIALPVLFDKLAIIPTYSFAKRLGIFIFFLVMISFISQIGFGALFKYDSRKLDEIGDSLGANSFITADVVDGCVLLRLYKYEQNDVSLDNLLQQSFAYFRNHDEKISSIGISAIDYTSTPSDKEILGILPPIDKKGYAIAVGLSSEITFDSKETERIKNYLGQDSSENVSLEINSTLKEFYGRDTFALTAVLQPVVDKYPHLDKPTGMWNSYPNLQNYLALTNIPNLEERMRHVASYYNLPYLLTRVSAYKQRGYAPNETTLSLIKVYSLNEDRFESYIRIKTRSDSVCNMNGFRFGVTAESLTK